MPRPTCITCRFCGDVTSRLRELDGMRECRFNPPGEYPAMTDHGGWPWVNATDWCGKHEPRAEEVPNAS